MFRYNKYNLQRNGLVLLFIIISCFKPFSLLLCMYLLCYIFLWLKYFCQKQYNIFSQLCKKFLLPTLKFQPCIRTAELSFYVYVQYIINIYIYYRYLLNIFVGVCNYIRPILIDWFTWIENEILPIVNKMKLWE